jgi:hypothetical protein
MSSTWAHSIACGIHGNQGLCTCKALDDRIETLRRDLDRERHALEVSERAEVEGRVADHGLWLRSLTDRRRRILVMEDELDQVVERTEARP